MKSLLQTKQWAELKKSQGWGIYAVDGIFVLIKKVPFGKSFLYVPEISFWNIAKINEFLQKISKIAQREKAIFLRMDLIDEKDEKIEKFLKKDKFIKAFEEIQPEHRQIISIDAPEEDILSQMKPKGRYNIKIALRSGVTIETSDDIDTFYNIFAATSLRDNFSIRPKKYFQDLMTALKPFGFAELLIAKYQGKAIAAEIVTFYDQTASYLYGASSNEYRNVMAPYLMHWEAIKLAKDKGCKYYDLLAVAPKISLPATDNRLPKENSVDDRPSAVGHKYAGITRFKQQFGGRNVSLEGSWDYVYSPIWYTLFKIAEKVRRR